MIGKMTSVAKEDLATVLNLLDMIESNSQGYSDDRIQWYEDMYGVGFGEAVKMCDDDDATVARLYETLRD